MSRTSLLDVDARAGRAFLPLRAERRAHDAVGRLVDVGAARDDGRILPAHLDNQRARHRARGVVAHELQADFLRAGEDDAVDAVVVDELLSDGRARSGDEVEHARRQAGLDHHLGELCAEQGRIARRLEDDGISRGQRAAGRTRRERERKIERRDHRPHAVRPQHADVVFAGPERAHLLDESVVLLDLIAVVGHQIRAFFDIADALEPVLADLVAHQRGELVAVMANRVRDAADGREPVLPRERGPCGIRRARGGDGRFHVLAMAFLKRAEHDARVDGAAIVELRVRFEVRAVDVEKMLAPERLRRVLRWRRPARDADRRASRRQELRK